MGEFASKGVAGAINKSGRIFIDKLNYFADEIDIEHLYNYIKSV